MANDNGKKIIVALVLALVVGGIAFALYSQYNNNKVLRSCELSDIKPANVNVSTVKNVASTDNKYIAFMAGQLEVKDIEQQEADAKQYIYLPIELKSLVALNSSTDSQDKKSRVSSLMLKDNCVEIKLNFEENKLNRYVNSIDVTRTKSNGDVEVCSINGAIGISAQLDHHYECKKSKSYNCTISTKDKNGKDVTKLVSTIVFDAIGFEVNGDPEKVKRLQFSTQADTC